MSNLNKTRRMLTNTFRHCHNLYNKVGIEEQTWLSEINQGAKDALELLTEQQEIIKQFESMNVSGGLVIEFTKEDYDMIVEYMKLSESISVRVAVMNAISIVLDSYD